ncbi:ADP-ribose pyrophosphatase YjhB, NUDIX family [Marinobacter daqiaonensis]|uniref:Phosphatase NudJ n=1 Tax=Marinobacter daqiaonensis TaxID=650891 RepID=A0A1I6H247_9GAMM|nr:NUDIX hydrolase [Marinobacter daqiaonensis]SFR48519.1 ADP-ribose pyrophosphatase YjhB, NUDIX family [Marinobacter daqiaonensis]
MTWTPHATVAVIVEDDQGRFLLVEEVVEGRRVFNQPAGHIEEGESVIQAARREALEETGWRVEPHAFLGMYRYVAPANGVTYFRFCFAAHPRRHVTDELDDGIVAAHWLPLEEIRQLGERLRSPMVLDCILDYRKGRRFPLDVIVEPEA